LCQGFLVSPASEVHHQTYRNFGSEFAFELVSLCCRCHDRLHQVDEGGA
jgi:5-methylcytosine-specific restriction endonuclease McrA